MTADRNRSTRPPDGLGRKLLRRSAYLVAGAVVLSAATLAGLRILLPEIEHYRPQIERWLSHVAERKVEIGTIDADWRGWTLVFRVRDVRLDGGGTSAGTTADSAIRLAALTFSIDPLDLLRSGAFRPREISASGASFVVVRRSDGSLAVEELRKFPTAEPRQSDGLAQWILGQAKISLFASRILWIDERHGLAPLPLDGVTLHVEQMDDRHRISGSFAPPEAGRIDFAMEMTGAPLASSWSGTAFVAAHDVDIARLGLDAGQSETKALSGIISGRVWSTWEDGRPVEAEGTIHARSPSVVHMESRRGVDEVSASFRVERTVDGWTLVARDLIVATPNGSWPSSSAAATWIPPRDGRDGEVVVNAAFARIEDLVALAAPNGGLVESPMLNALFEAAPRGALEDFHVSMPVTDHVEIERIRANGRFTDLHIDPEAWSVSVDAASGQFEASVHGVTADVVTGRLRMSAPSWGARPLQGEKLAGIFAAIPAPEGIRVRFDGINLATSAGIITTDGWMFVPRDESEPELSVAVSLGASQIAAVRDLLAGPLIPEPLSRWIEAAMPFGDLHGTRMTFRGRLSKMPFSDGAGQFEATAKLVVPVFGYARGWPEITDVSAVVRFDGRRFDARIESGHIGKSIIREARMTIEDVSAEVPVARIEGRVEGASANAVRFLTESPLQARFAPMLDAFAIHGDSAIDLKLAIPLRGDDRSVTTGGTIALDDNRIDRLGLGGTLAAVTGPIAFQGTAVHSDGITATWLGQPIHARIGASPEVPNALRVSISGHLTRGLLAAYLHDAGLLEGPTLDDSPLLARVRGDSAWNATIDIPTAGDDRSVKLHIASDLTGLTLDLPPPFGKTSGTAHLLSIDSRIAPDANRITEVRLGTLASAVLELVPDAGRFRLGRGAIRIGGGPVTLPDGPGLTVHGAVPALDTGAWHALLEDIAALRTQGSKAPRIDHVREVSIDADSVTALGRQYPDTRIRAARGADGGWRLDLAGRHLEGVVHLPRDPRAEPVTMDFERLVFEPGATRAGNEPADLDPRTLPALSFSARRFVLGDYELGSVRFTTRPTEHGLEIERLDVRADSFEGEATGHWSLADEEHLTEFVMRMHGVDVGRLLGSLGFDGNALTGGTTDISLRGTWNGTPADFSLDRFTGVMHFLSTDGRLTRLQPGVTGRVFGLLTITSLPRRLILDFGDLFKDGFEYDRIDGRFAIEKGNAHTDDLFMESDTARFEMVGRTGLVSEDYDQLVTVIPKISSSLPLVPIWIAQKILDRNVFDKAFAYQYTITGTWNEPVVELVRTERRQGVRED